MAEMAILMTVSSGCLCRMHGRGLTALEKTVCIYAYLNNCEPFMQGEVSALINLFRTLGGFAVPYWQISWCVFSYSA
jgi:hypothetical protein